MLHFPNSCLQCSFIPQTTISHSTNLKVKLFTSCRPKKKKTLQCRTQKNPTHKIIFTKLNCIRSRFSKGWTKRSHTLFAIQCFQFANELHLCNFVWTEHLWIAPLQSFLFPARPSPKATQISNSIKSMKFVCSFAREIKISPEQCVPATQWTEPSHVSVLISKRFQCKK